MMVGHRVADRGTSETSDNCPNRSSDRSAHSGAADSASERSSLIGKRNLSGSADQPDG
jgi:hypothetical protein